MYKAIRLWPLMFTFLLCLPVTCVFAQRNGVSINAVVTMQVGKGFILVFNSPGELETPSLNNVNIQNLLYSTIKWFDQDGSGTLQLWGKSGVKELLGRRPGYHIIDTTEYHISPETGVVVLTEDIKDTTELSHLHSFLIDGGTFILGAPLSGNKKTGVTTNPLLIPILHDIETTAYKQWSTPQQQRAIIALSTALTINPVRSAVINNIKKHLYLDEAPPIIPSPQMPVVNSDWQTRMAYVAQQILRGRQAGLNDIDPASKIFPGAVADSARRISTTITIPVKVGTQGLWDPEPVFYRWHSTGLYVPAGEKVTVTINDKDTAQHLKAQIGVHEDYLTKTDRFLRTPFALTSSFELNKGSTAIQSSYGGILLIKIADTCTLKNITVSVKGAVKYPYFKLGTTSITDWKNTIRNYGAPWAELASDKIILTVPANRIRFLDDPEKLLKFWDEVMDADARLAAIDPQRKHPERIITDAQVAYGALFTNDSRIIGPDGQATMDMLNEHFMRTQGSWGYFHELGHRHQFWELDFDGTAEVTVNLFSMYILDKVLHKGIYSPPNIADKETVIEQTKAYMADNPSFEKWKENPFVALRMYIELIEGFGWGPIEQVYQNFRNLPKNKHPKTDTQKRDLWFIQISNATHKNLGNFFDKWKIPITIKAKKQVSGLPVWLPDELK